MQANAAKAKAGGQPAAMPVPKAKKAPAYKAAAGPVEALPKKAMPTYAKAVVLQSCLKHFLGCPFLGHPTKSKVAPTRSSRIAVSQRVCALCLAMAWGCMGHPRCSAAVPQSAPVALGEGNSCRHPATGRVFWADGLLTHSP